jgi:hypothetical protein
MLIAARITIPLKKGKWANCARLSMQLDNNIVKEKDQQSAAAKVYGTNLRWISNMRAFGEMAIIVRHSYKKIRNKLADGGNTFMFVGYSIIHEKDIYQFMNIAIKKTMFSRDVIWLNKTCSQYMGISQVDLITSEVEDEELEEEEVFELEGEGNVGTPPAITQDDHIEHQMDVPETTSNPTIVAPFPTSTRQDNV